MVVSKMKKRYKRSFCCFTGSKKHHTSRKMGAIDKISFEAHTFANIDIMMWIDKNKPFFRYWQNIYPKEIRNSNKDIPLNCFLHAPSHYS